ncbi:AcrR family transcriptional regulator [Arthrobacter woluwensis]|uniref:hypothetical protein n=1 Tax=Arthrobacter woluwensis TaxID=156980 RepID=UPI00278B50EE|nr:hypothetical protein [Arthrobacter woluwensis]MDQ0708996.1 AcrR family transcriptional regulator [Arthrobacter woluwensis]
MISDPEGRQEILAAAALLLVSAPLADTTLEDVAQVLRVPVRDVGLHFGSVREIGAAILDAEGDSMREAQRVGAAAGRDPLAVLQATFHAVAVNISSRPIVRAGIRIAQESRHLYPERRIDPFRTWKAFVVGQLELAKSAGRLRPGVECESAAWLIVSSGLGTKELVAFTGRWDELPGLMADTIGQIVTLLEADGEPARRAG